MPTEPVRLHEIADTILYLEQRAANARNDAANAKDRAARAACLIAAEALERARLFVDSRKVALYGRER
jgi:hypothetical protein